jgi:hypothetical protein
VIGGVATRADIKRRIRDARVSALKPSERSKSAFDTGRLCK